MKHKKTCTIAIVGCGTIGSAAAGLIVHDSKLMEEKTGLILKLKYIVDIDFSRAEKAGLNNRLYEKDFGKVLNDPEVDIVVELIGGIDVARKIIEKALNSKKSVVTANKALMAHYGTELITLAHKNGVLLSFEASCVGGVPVIRALYDGLLTNRIDAIFGIVNGTCNYILTAMIQKGQNYADALAEAQKSGLAEADPALDVSGIDSAHKLAILASLAMAQKIDFNSIPVKGIDNLELMDISFGQELGYIVKLLAVAERMEKGISLRVRPVFITKEHPLAWVSGPFNAISIYGHALGHTMYYGRGAGGLPTASAVLSDIVSITLGSYAPVFNNIGIWPDTAESAKQLPRGDIQSRYYIRSLIEDKPGVFAKLAAILGKYGISISSALQRELSEDIKNSTAAPVVITTHSTLERKIDKALEEINKLDSVIGKSVCISIIDEHEETLHD